MATLRTFDEKVKTESVAEKRAEIDKKVDERIATDRRKILEEKRALMQKKNEKEKLLGLLQEKQGFGDLVCSFCFALKDFGSRSLTPQSQSSECNLPVPKRPEGTFLINDKMICKFQFQKTPHAPKKF